MITESESKYNNLENLSFEELLRGINQEDKTVAHAVAEGLPQIEIFLENAYPKLQSGGRLFYIGAGTSGRLGIVDASECPPTFGVSETKVIGIIAGGDGAIRKAVEFSEDDISQGWEDLKQYKINYQDVLIGITASGKTPYVIGAIEMAKSEGIMTACITCNQASPLAEKVDFPIEIIVGPEFITGSTRMKAGTAQKMVLNMISTGLMIKLGHVKGNKMIDMQLNNKKLHHRAVQMVMDLGKVDKQTALKLLDEHHSVRNVLIALNNM